MMWKCELYSSLSTYTYNGGGWVQLYDTESYDLSGSYMVLKLRLCSLSPLTNRKAGNCVAVNLVLAKHRLITQIDGFHIKYDRNFVHSFLLACKIKSFKTFFTMLVTLIFCFLIKK
jgi:hypothetical protein